MAKYKENKFKLMMLDSEKNSKFKFDRVNSPVIINYSRNDNLPRLDFGNLSQEKIGDLQSEDFQVGGRKQREIERIKLDELLLTNKEGAAEDSNISISNSVRGKGLESNFKKSKISKVLSP